MPRSSATRSSATADPDGEVAARVARLEARLAEFEEKERAGAAELAEDAIDRMVSRFMPPEARRHLRAARKEQLLAARSFIDHWIERLDRPPAAPARRARRSGSTPRRRESIPLE